MSKNILVIGKFEYRSGFKDNSFSETRRNDNWRRLFTFQGGKGANQAVAAARAGGDVRFICKVGNDAFGNEAIRHYGNEGIDVSTILKHESAPTGVAVITVNAEGENSIIVASGANAMLSVEDIQSATEVLGTSDWILTQLETPLPVVEYLSRYAVQHGKKLVLNPAPANVLSDDVYHGLFLITPNETETQLLTGTSVTDEESAKQAAEMLKARGVANVIITMGSKGAFVHTREFQGVVESVKVKAVDTTAAGDVFNGALVVALSEQRGWREAVQFACRAAAVSVTKMGAQSSAPTREEIELI